MEDRLVIETPEQVELSYELAGLGSRFAAGVLDCLLVTLIIIVLGAILVAALGLSVSGLSDLVHVDEDGTPQFHLRIVSWSTALLMFAIFAVYWGYYFFFEVVGNGRTPGKRELGLRVICDGGYPITAPAAAIRNLLRVVDGQPLSSYVVGGAIMLLSRECKRLGDYAAGTVVIKERVPDYRARTDKRKRKGAEPRRVALPEEYDPRLTPREAAMVQGFLDRRAELNKDARERLAASIARPLMARMGETGVEAETFLVRLMSGEGTQGPPGR